METTQRKRYDSWLFYLIAFVEGGSLMGVELIGAKMMAPAYGNTLYVWSAVLGITLGGLATGYFIGGRLSELSPYKYNLFRIMLTSAVLVGLMPWLASFILDLTLSMHLFSGIVLSLLLYLFPPLVCFGMVSPLIIQLLTNQLKQVGRIAGSVYAVSTTGGIIATFWFGFYSISFIGLNESAYIVSSVLAFFPLAFFTFSLVKKITKKEKI